ncbi:MAG: cell division protein FtsZ [Pseudomonadota bacterium]
MAIQFQMPESVELKPRIVVIGVGGAGGNAVNNMIEAGLDGVEFVVANTDAQALALSKAERRVQMGSGITQGLGAGMRPEVGEQSAEESLDAILEHLDGAHMLFVAAGMGGGTGTGAAPVIARAARDRGILTVGIVTKPFMFEGSRRMKLAEQGIENLYSSVDTMITIPNQNLFRVATERTTMADAFQLADEVLYSGVRGVTDLMVVPGQINLDFNDVRTVMDEMGKAMMGTGEATGDQRAAEAAQKAINNPLLDDVSLKGAKGVLINITGGEDLTLFEVEEAAEMIRGQVDEDANIIVGSALDAALDGVVRVSVVATGVDAAARSDTPGRFAEPAKPNKATTQAVNSGAASTPVVELGVHEKAEAEARAAYAEYGFEDEVEPVAVNAPPAPTSRSYPPRVQGGVAQPVSAQPVSAKPVSAEPVIARVAPAPDAPSPTLPVSDAVPEASKNRRAFGLWNRKPRRPVGAPEVVQPSVAPKSAAQTSGDLFGDDMEDELEIPSFLRRQSR